MFNLRVGTAGKIIFDRVWKLVWLLHDSERYALLKCCAVVPPPRNRDCSYFVGFRLTHITQGIRHKDTLPCLRVVRLKYHADFLDLARVHVTSHNVDEIISQRVSFKECSYKRRGGGGNNDERIRLRNRCNRIVNAW